LTHFEAAKSRLHFSESSPNCPGTIVDRLKTMTKVPREVSGFAAFPVTFPATKAYPTNSKHYIFVKPHDPKILDEDAPRSLFLANIPATTSEIHLKHLFATQLSSGRVERIGFSDESAKSSQVVNSEGKTGKKRKRVTAEELEGSLESYTLPEIWQSRLHTSGAHAVVVFVDRPSMEASLKAVKKAIKLGTEVIWGKGIEEKVPPQGLQRYSIHNKLRYPSRKELLHSVNEYMSAYSQMEEARSREAAKKRQLPDEDGFVTVTKGAVRREEANEVAERAKEKSKGFENFYRFQTREKLKEQQGELVRKFEEDKRRVEEMRKRRGKMRVCCCSSNRDMSDC
jgi:ribosomal RNA-processing protein 7